MKKLTAAVSANQTDLGNGNSFTGKLNRSSESVYGHHAVSGRTPQGDWRERANSKPLVVTRHG